MTDEEQKVGPGRPPKSGQFKPGVSGNPAGRPPDKQPDGVIDVIKNTLDAPIEYPDRGRTKTATRSEFGWRKLIEHAVQGQLSAIATVLKLLASPDRAGDNEIETIEITNWRQDYPGQTAAQKTQEFAAAKQAKPSKPPKSAR